MRDLNSMTRGELATEATDTARSVMVTSNFVREGDGGTAALPTLADQWRAQAARLREIADAVEALTRQPGTETEHDAR